MVAVPYIFEFRWYKNYIYSNMHGPLLLNLHAYIQQYPPKIATSLQTREQLRSRDYNDDDDDNNESNESDGRMTACDGEATTNQRTAG